MIFALYPLLFFVQDGSTSFPPVGPTDRRITFEIEGDKGITDSRYDITVELENGGRVVQASSHIVETGETEGLVFELLVGFEDHDITCGIEENTMGVPAHKAEDLVIPNPWTVRSVRVEQLDPADRRHLTAWIRQSAIAFADRAQPEARLQETDGFESFDLSVLDCTGDGVEISLVLRGCSEEALGVPETFGQISLWADRDEKSRELAVLLPFLEEQRMNPSSSKGDDPLQVETGVRWRLTEVAFALKPSREDGRAPQVVEYSMNAR